MLTLPGYAWHTPTTVDEALRLLADPDGGAMIIAGGTDAVPNMKHGLHEPRAVVHVSRVEELRGMHEREDGLVVGAGVTLAEFARDPRVARPWPQLAKAASLVASPQIRNMGTLGGNLCLDTRCTYYNQTFFWREALGFCLKKDGTRCHVVPQGRRCVAAHASDVAPVLISLGAEVEIANLAGRRWLPVEQFFVGDGVHNNVLTPGELVTRIRVPAAARGLVGGYQKLRPRGSIDFPMLSVAVAARRDAGRLSELRVVVSALGAKPRQLGGLAACLGDGVPGEALAGRVAAVAATQCRPLTNVPYDADWRQAMVPVFVKRALRDAFEAS